MDVAGLGPVKSILCTACAEVPGYQRHLCHECHGVGFIEIDDVCRRKGLDWFDNCPISYDPMCSGWECSKCGGSGPWPSEEAIAKLRGLTT